MDIITDIFLLLDFEMENTISYFFRPPAALSPRENQLDFFCISVHLHPCKVWFSGEDSSVNIIMTNEIEDHM